MLSSSIPLLHSARGDAVAPRLADMALPGADPFAAGREVVWQGAHGLSAGRGAFAGEIEVESYPHLEVAVVTAGRLEIETRDGAQLVVVPGEGIVLPRGAELRIRAALATSWSFCAWTGEADGAAQVTKLVADAALSPSAAPPQEALIGPAPQCRSFNAFKDGTARLRAGLWDSTPYRRIERPHKVSELMHILAGNVILTGADGTTVTAGEGDTVFVPAGTPCAWDSATHVAKFYVVQEPDG